MVIYDKPRVKQYADRMGRVPLVACPSCGKMVPKESVICRYCGDIITVGRSVRPE